ncbi:hypothetical protein C8Q80DRAFT_1229408 [Daedaleopsis nitida]|nr:hypothetical protein C8Q80DRAFT_1229408 [Daedaleopsis nitida]
MGGDDRIYLRGGTARVPRLMRLEEHTGERVCPSLPHPHPTLRVISRGFLRSLSRQELCLWSTRVAHHPRHHMVPEQAPTRCYRRRRKQAGARDVQEEAARTLHDRNTLPPSSSVRPLSPGRRSRMGMHHVRLLLAGSPGRTHGEERGRLRQDQTPVTRSAKVGQTSQRQRGESSRPPSYQSQRDRGGDLRRQAERSLRSVGGAGRTSRLEQSKQRRPLVLVPQKAQVRSLDAICVSQEDQRSSERFRLPTANGP